MSTKKRVLIISPIPTHPPEAGTRTGIASLARMLAELGLEVHFLYTDYEKGDIAAMRAEWGDRFHHAPFHWPRRTVRRTLRHLRYVFREDFWGLRPVDAWYDPSLDEHVRTLHNRFHFDVAIAEYVFWSKALEQLPGSVLKMVDTHDVFAMRHLLYTRRKLRYGWFSTPPEEEARGLSRADVVVAISESDAEYFRSVISNRVVTVGRTFDIWRPDEARPVAGRMLFVASHTPINVDGLTHFVDAVLPKIRSAIPDAELYVVGAVGEAVEGRDGVVCLGRVPDIRTAYASASVVVNPVRFSTGISTKGLEALAHARPLVATVPGAAGLTQHLRGEAVIADSDEEFTGASVRLLRDTSEAARMAEAAHAFAIDWNKRSLAALADALRDIPTV
jgi:glycosyltransferase involved in cell wall biosynthesis